jgi:hypothetical protein
MYGRTTVVSENRRMICFVFIEKHEALTKHHTRFTCAQSARVGPRDG